MWAARVFLAVLAIAWADRLTAREYRPETEAALFRPEKPVEALRQPIPCLRPAERPKALLWLLRDKDGNTIVIGAMDVRRMC